MRKLWKLALAAALTCAAVVSVPSRVSATHASSWCNGCEQTGDCYACCRCDHGGAGECLVICG